MSSDLMPFLIPDAAPEMRHGKRREGVPELVEKYWELVRSSTVVQYARERKIWKNNCFDGLLKVRACLCCTVLV